MIMMNGYCFKKELCYYDYSLFLPLSLKKKFQQTSQLNYVLQNFNTLQQLSSEMNFYYDYYPLQLIHLQIHAACSYQSLLKTFTTTMSVIANNIESIAIIKELVAYMEWLISFLSYFKLYNMNHELNQQEYCELQKHL